MVKMKTLNLLIIAIVSFFFLSASQVAQAQSRAYKTSSYQKQKDYSQKKYYGYKKDYGHKKDYGQKKYYGHKKHYGHGQYTPKWKCKYGCHGKCKHYCPPHKKPYYPSKWKCKYGCHGKCKHYPYYRKGHDQHRKYPNKYARKTSYRRG